MKTEEAKITDIKTEFGEEISNAMVELQTSHFFNDLLRNINVTRLVLVRRKDVLKFQKSYKRPKDDKISAWDGKNVGAFQFMKLPVYAVLIDDIIIVSPQTVEEIFEMGPKHVWFKYLKEKVNIDWSLKFIFFFSVFHEVAHGLMERNIKQLKKLKLSGLATGDADMDKEMRADCIGALLLLIYYESVGLAK